eukprot:CAMPEP_0113321162 /NCGR_PEP_ID=MMETSP0010_2-20120614/14735_1 /TAXON_ID=216773 ORGANISM="Corethron hystrix, Strain 308" /NCGR_SAMPLE_ID=MMETSP0010_2 /ASSEMBLY_ACC=CAM_ASM_000155 /LENGTH=217 /DNA_ID=CAMNT_0000179197 /DNA_START=133 /DNA_END=784 /DNA_ORIENTATION=- /assembly_acc=CAM_ASM_000155
MPHAAAAAASASEEGLDTMLIRATESLRSGNLEEAAQLADTVRDRCAEGSEMYTLANMIASRAAPASGTARAAASAPPSDTEAVAARLAARAGPVAFSPQAESSEEVIAMREGDAAVSRTVSAMSVKDFVAAFKSLEEARECFQRAGEEVLQARAMTVDNLYGYIIAERERNVRLRKLIRMKEILATKRSLEDDGEERITRALSQKSAEFGNDESAD